MKRTLLTCTIFAATALCSCNSDIFVDRPDIPETTTVSIEGDGGECTVDISSKELERLVLDITSDHSRFCSYYNHAGEIIDRNAPAADVSRIVYDDDFEQLVVERRGNKLDIHSVCNTSDHDIVREIRLEYPYGNRYVRINIGPGEPLVLEDVACPEELTDMSNSRKTVSRITVNNESPLPTTTVEWPYLNEVPTLLIEPHYTDKWIEDKPLSIPVPVYGNGEWRLADMGEMLPGHKYHIGGPDRHTQVEITIPAESHVTVTTDVIYSTATTSGSLLFLNRILDRPIIAEYNVTSTYPTGYDIRIDELP
ncbi:MAG: hypothetical protein K2L21_04210 [Muribaculaceae bacterium]|nr:hypothetical protein [Muribaculaceae bacterium]